ncbi:MAG: 1,4-dihydroxy-2-naphthoate octaprenyltransferase [Chlamydiae bacterium]|nr:1,4-dihydroxy-2-naphthoate octaprenyltransferase [Chlamydiota bacterium]
MQDSQSVPNIFKAWALASRPNTLIASLSPVVIAASLASSFDPKLFLLCLFFSMFIQIGANVANDYFDYVKGTDTAERIGPARAAQSGWITLSQLKMGMFCIFTAAVLISVPLLMRGGVFGVWIVIASVISAIFYTAGSKPLGYLGLGEVFVFLFYGPIAVLSTYYILTLSFTPLVFYASLPPAFLSCAILIANNLRDEKSDRSANKKTLVVRFGKRFGQWEYALSLGLAAFLPLALAWLRLAPLSWTHMGLFLPFLYPALKLVFRAKEPKELIPLLPLSARLLAIYTLLFLLIHLL